MPVISCGRELIVSLNWPSPSYLQLAPNSWGFPFRLFIIKNPSSNRYFRARVMSFLNLLCFMHLRKATNKRFRHAVTDWLGHAPGSARLWRVELPLRGSCHRRTSDDFRDTSGTTRAAAIVELVNGGTREFPRADHRRWKRIPSGGIQKLINGDTGN